MPKVLTDQYRNATFILPFTEDKSEYALVKPVSDTAIGELRIQANKEAGADENLASSIFIRLLLCKALTDWRGFYDVSGKEIPFSTQAIREICEADPEFVSLLVLRVRNVARLGELEERKN